MEPDELILVNWLARGYRDGSEAEDGRANLSRVRLSGGNAGVREDLGDVVCLWSGVCE